MPIFNCDKGRNHHKLQAQKRFFVPNKEQKKSLITLLPSPDSSGILFLFFFKKVKDRADSGKLLQKNNIVSLDCLLTAATFETNDLYLQLELKTILKSTIQLK